MADATIDLSRLAEPFPAEDIEWRVSRAGMGKSGIYCNCLAYITARAIQTRLDEVCGPANWRNEQPILFGDVRPITFLCGVSIWLGEWVTKWDVAEPTNIEPAKGGFSGAMKRAGAQWGIGRYLYHLDEAFAEVSDTRVGRDWRYARLPKDSGGTVYYWKPPSLPGWALPKESEHAITAVELGSLKKLWRTKRAAEIRNPAALREGFGRFVISTVGEFPHADHTTWTRDALDRCVAALNGPESAGVSSDVPFED